MLIKRPKLPFHGYKWRWATYQPTEGLNVPEVYLGVLRVFRRHEGVSPSSPRFAENLRVVQVETKTAVDLVRTPTRNLIRNSGQYWKSTGLLVETRGRIELTPFGEQVADGKITKSEFAATVVRTLKLPNPNIMSVEEIEAWKNADVTIKPFELILSILDKLREIHGESQAYMAPNELIRIVIPLAGNNAEVEEHVNALIAWRNGDLDLSGWPDCAPEANDRRIAREFLLFLEHYGFCKAKRGRGSRYDFRFFVCSADAKELLRFEPEEDPLDTARVARASQFPATIDRQRIITSILSRPQQSIFRKEVLRIFGYRCMITGDDVPEALEAAHIIPVQYEGTDTPQNGLCLRADIHNLFDSGHIRIAVEGGVHFSEATLSSVSYRNLPHSVDIPPFVSRQAVKWRWDYC